MQIGPYTLKNNIVVAPMAGVTDRPFRQLCKKYGAGMAVSEMVTSNSLLYGSSKTIRRANHDGEVEPISVQIAGADPQMMAEAAQYNADKGAQIIDINMGCPAKKICNVMAGSALLQHEDLVNRILEAVVKVSLIPVTLKIRTGWDKQNKNAITIAKIAENSDFPIEVIVGPEYVTGSSRMKAGTAQKMILNMISTTVMIKLGRIHDNKMIDMKLSNNKLYERAVRILKTILDIETETAKKLIEEHKNIRTAIENFKK